MAQGDLVQNNAQTAANAAGLAAALYQYNLQYGYIDNAILNGVTYNSK